MMDYFYVFEYQQAAEVKQNGNTEPLQLSTLKATKINVNLPDILSCDDSENILSFSNMHTDITQEKVLFKKMLQQVVKAINNMTANLVNVTLVCEDIKLFTQIIPRECQKRQIAVPYALMNFLDVKEIVRNEYQCPFRQLNDIVEFLGICTVKEAETKSQTQLLERILKKLYYDGKLLSTSQRFVQKCSQALQGLQKKFEPVLFKYFKIIGLPFKSFPAEILQILAPEVPENLKEICFIYDRQRFSGRGIIKVPQDYEPFLIRKNRMYIGQRYIQLEGTTQQQFEKAKIRLEHRSQDRNGGFGSRHDFRDERDQRNFGRSRRSRSRSPVEPHRSRQRHESQRNDPRPQRDDRPVIRPFEQDLSNPSSNEYGIKVRGLPFVFSEWDVENVFNYHNIIGGSVKLGIKPGTTLKNGEAVILMRSYDDAQKTLDMNGFRCMGRYLQVKVIGKDEYLKYK